MFFLIKLLITFSNEELIFLAVRTRHSSASSTIYFETDYVLKLMCRQTANGSGLNKINIEKTCHCPKCQAILAD